MTSDLHISAVSREKRARVEPIIDQSFNGLYRWHARRILRSVQWVTEAVHVDARVGVAMFTLLGKRSAYVYYLAVVPSQRAKGIGGMLLDDALNLLLESGALEVFACVRTDNIPSLRLIQSRDFVRTGFRELIASKGFAPAAKLWMQMVVAPGEKVFRKVVRP